MKKYLFSIRSSPLTTGLGLLFIRLMFGFGMMAGHGWGKLLGFSDNMNSFSDPLGIGSAASLTGAVFAEFVCAALVGLGLFTRAALVPLIFTMFIAAFVVHSSDPFSTKEMALLYLTAFIGLFFTGPGKFSLDQKLR